MVPCQFRHAASEACGPVRVESDFVSQASGAQNSDLKQSILLLPDP